MSNDVSTTTTGSSRALSAFGAIVLVVVLSGTPASNIPPLSLLVVDAVWRYVIALGLIVFMIIAHAVNLWYDSLENERREGTDALELYWEKLARYDRSRGEPKTIDEINTAVAEVNARLERIEPGLQMSSWVKIRLMHTIVPLGVGGMAVIALLVRIYDCVTAGCC